MRTKREEKVTEMTAGKCQIGADVNLQLGRAWGPAQELWGACSQAVVLLAVSCGVSTWF